MILVKSLGGELKVTVTGLLVATEDKALDFPVPSSAITSHLTVLALGMVTSIKESEIAPPVVSSCFISSSEPSCVVISYTL